MPATCPLQEQVGHPGCDVLRYDQQWLLEKTCTTADGKTPHDTCNTNSKVVFLDAKGDQSDIKDCRVKSFKDGKLTMEGKGCPDESFNCTNCLGQSTMQWKRVSTSESATPRPIANPPRAICNVTNENEKFHERFLAFDGKVPTLDTCRTKCLNEKCSYFSFFGAQDGSQGVCDIFKEGAPPCTPIQQNNPKFDTFSAFNVNNNYKTKRITSTAGDAGMFSAAFAESS